MKLLALSYPFIPGPKADRQTATALLSWLIIGCGLMLYSSQAAAFEPGLEAGETVVISEIVDGDTVVMAVPIGGAREIRLVGIQAPKLPLGRWNFKKWPLADRAKALLGKLTKGQSVTLAYGGRRMDRHGRLLAHLYGQNGIWIQGALLERGMARVYSFADNRTAITAMLEREQLARTKRLGIWRHGFYTIRSLENLDRHIGSFQLVEGRIQDVAEVRGRGFLNFGENWRTDFTISIAPKNLRKFKSESVDIMGLDAKRVRVRGWLRSFNGPMIEVTHPEQIEVLEE